jgi:hypothetical protein
MIGKALAVAAVAKNDAKASIPDVADESKPPRGRIAALVAWLVGPPPGNHDKPDYAGYTYLYFPL